MTIAPAAAGPVVNSTSYFTPVALIDVLDSVTDRSVAVAANAVVSGAASDATMTKAATKKPACLVENFVCFTLFLPKNLFVSHLTLTV